MPIFLPHLPINGGKESFFPSGCSLRFDRIIYVLEISKVYATDVIRSFYRLLIKKY